MPVVVQVREKIKSKGMYRAVAGKIGNPMLKRLIKRLARMVWWEGFNLLNETVDLPVVLKLGFQSFQQSMDLGSIESLARSGVGGWLLAQEKARLEFVAAREEFSRRNDMNSFQMLLARLLRLHSTNALVQALVNERAAERLLAASLERGAAAARGPRPCSVPTMHGKEELGGKAA
jgi:hypothetical protein